LQDLLTEKFIAAQENWQICASALEGRARGNTEKPRFRGYCSGSAALIAYLCF